MKCEACHHLNLASEPECFMCGTALVRGLPPTHPILYVFLAGCIFLIVFSAIGGASAIQPNADSGFTTRPSRAQSAKGVKPAVAAYAFRLSGLQIHPIPIVLGLIGIRGVMYITRLDTPVTRQIAMGFALMVLVWAIYFVGLMVTI